MPETKSIAPFGSWSSPIDADMLATKNRRQSFPRFFDGALYWLESQPEQQGRTVVKRQHEGAYDILTPESMDVHTRAQEYGGICYTVGGGCLFFVNSQDQRIYQLPLPSATDNTSSPTHLRAITTQNRAKYADLIYDPKQQRILCIEEREESGLLEPVTRLVSFSILDSEVRTVIAEGADFYAHPRLSPCGNHLLWLSWNHPDMPWDSASLWQASFDENGAPFAAKQLSADGESVFQPEWSEHTEIFYISDRDGWWHLYRHNFSANTSGIDESGANEGMEECIFAPKRECGLPLWQFGMTTWGFLNADTILVTHCLGGEWQLSSISLDRDTTNISNAINTSTSPVTLASIDEYLHLNHFSDIATDSQNQKSAFLTAGPLATQQLCVADHSDFEANAKIHFPGGISDQLLTQEAISSGQAITFPTTNGDHARGYFYPPTHTTFKGPLNERPPLIVICHGGPTASTTASFNFKVQFWTSRGFAVFDVNYRGSTGYGRAYREKLNGKWGLSDVEDACAAAKYAVNADLCDPKRLIIRGSSAGGYTVLSALCFHDTFSAGCSLYGIGDVEMLTNSTHKFEARYTDSLIAPLSDQQTYQDRSPLQHVEQFNCPVIFFQGLQDKVVPPEQAELMVEALNSKSIPVSYISFPHEGHGFRDPLTSTLAFNTELAFYGKIFGFNTDSPVQDLEIRNLDRG